MFLFVGRQKRFPSIPSVGLPPFSNHLNFRYLLVLWIGIDSWFPVDIIWFFNRFVCRKCFEYHQPDSVHPAPESTDHCLELPVSNGFVFFVIFWRDFFLFFKITQDASTYVIRSLRLVKSIQCSVHYQLQKASDKLPGLNFFQFRL